MQNIEPAVAGDGFGDGGLDAAALGDIAADEVAITARIGRQRSGRLRGSLAKASTMPGNRSVYSRPWRE